MKTRIKVIKYIILLNCMPFLNACNENKEPKIELPLVEARSAYDFYHSIGVCTHLGYANTSYNDFDGIIYPRLLELGIKHIRDGYSGRMSYDEQDRRYAELSKAGIKLLFNTGNSEPTDLMPRIKKIVPYLSGIEGSNEVDLSYNRDINVWLPWAIDRQQKLYELIKNTSETKDLPVINFSLADLKSNAEFVGNQSNKLDYGNLHIYAAGRHPANHWGYGISEQEALMCSELISGNKPVMMTECGYHNHVYYPQSHPGTPEEIAAIYIPHLYFEYFNEGITRSYIYEFINEDVIGHGEEDKPMEMHFGMLYSDGSPKPSYTAIKNLISLISDEQQVNALPLNFEFKTGTELGKKYLRHTLLHKSDGSWWIALYRTNELFDTTFLVTKNPAPEKMTLNLEEEVREINVYIPNQSVDRQKYVTNKRSIEFDLPSELVLIEIRK